MTGPLKQLAEATAREIARIFAERVGVDLSTESRRFITRAVHRALVRAANQKVEAAAEIADKVMEEWFLSETPEVAVAAESITHEINKLKEKEG